MNERRDLDLGARLDELEVREHGPDYWNSVMKAVEPDLARLRTVENKTRRPIAAFIARHSTFGGGFKWWAAAAVAAAVGVAALLVGLPGQDDAVVLGPAPATAAEAVGYALTALDRYPGLEGTVSWESAGAATEDRQRLEMDFLSTPNGDLRIDSRLREAAFAPHTVRETLAYDAKARTITALTDWSEIDPSPSVTGSSSYYPRRWMEQLGVAPAEPDRGLPEGRFPLWRVRAYLRAMLSDPEVRFTTAERDGQTVWVLTSDAVSERWAPGGIKPVAEPVTITIDAATRLPVLLERSGIPGAGGYYPEVTRFDIHPLVEPPARDRFTLERPTGPGTSVNDGSSGFGGGDQRFRDLPFGDDAAMRKASSGMAAFPRWLPRGFALTGATSRDDGTGTSYRPRPGAPERFVPLTIVSLCFRRGYDQAFVSVRVDPRLHSSTTRGTGKDKVRTDTSDPFVRDVQPEVAGLWAAHTEDVRLRAGWFAGAVAHVVLEPETWPHLWVKKGPYVACIAGDLTRGQMVRMAGSLEPWAGGSAD